MDVTQSCRDKAKNPHPHPPPPSYWTGRRTSLNPVEASPSHFPTHTQSPSPVPTYHPTMQFYFCISSPKLVKVSLITHWCSGTTLTAFKATKSNEICQQPCHPIVHPYNIDLDITLKTRNVQCYSMLFNSSRSFAILVIEWHGSLCVCLVYLPTPVLSQPACAVRTYQAFVTLYSCVYRWRWTWGRTSGGTRWRSQV